MPRKTRIAIIALAVVLALGVFIAAQLTYIHVRVTDDGDDYKSFCNFNATLNCEAVARSAYSTFSGIPISILGGLTYLLSLVLLIACWRGPGRSWRAAAAYLQWLGMASFAYSIFLAWICYAEVGSWCLLCIALYGINLLFCLLAWISSDLPLAQHPAAFAADWRWLAEKRSRLAAAALLAALLGGFFAFGAYRDYSQRQEAIAETLAALAKAERGEAGKDSPFRRVEIVLEAPGELVANPDGRLTLVVYSDFLCPYCAETEHMLEELAADWPDLRLVRKDFPLDNACNAMLKRPFHPNACLAAVYAQCAGLQGRYRAYHDYLFEHQRELSAEFLAASVAGRGLDAAAFQTCLDGPEAKARVAATVEEGVRLKLPGTPTLVLDGRVLVVGGLPREQLEGILQAWTK